MKNILYEMPSSLHNLTRLSIFLLVCIIFSITTQHTYAKTLEKALTEAYINNPKIKSAWENLKSTDEESFQAFSGWLPSINVDYQNGLEEVNRGPVSSNGDIETKSILLSQPIYHGGATLAKSRQAKNLIMSARYNLLATEQEVLLTAIATYLDVLRNTQILKLAQNNEAVLKEHLDATKQRVQLGELTKTDLALAEARLAMAYSTTTKAEGDLANTKAEYEKVIGSQPTALSMPNKIAKINASKEELIDIALKQNANIKIAEFEQLAAKSDISVKKAALLPSVFLDANKQESRTSESLFFNSNESDSSSVTLKVSIPIFQSGAEYSRIRQSSANAEKLKYDLLDIQNQTRQAVITILHNFATAKATVKSAKAATKAALLALEGVIEEEKKGTRANIDILDARQELLDAKTEFVKAKHDEILHSYELYAAIGNLSAKNLGLDVKLLDPDNHYQKTKLRLIGF